MVDVDSLLTRKMLGKYIHFYSFPNEQKHVRVVLAYVSKIN